MKSIDHWTPAIIVMLPLFIGLLDVLLLRVGTNKATISYTALKISTVHPLVPLSLSYSFAVLMGHLFFPDLKADENPTSETVARMFLVLSPTIYCMIVIGMGASVELKRDALNQHGWQLAGLMLVASVLGGLAGRYGLPQHVPPDDPVLQGKP